MDKRFKNIIINCLMDYQPEMIGIFGSYARNESRHDSDIDILVRFKSALSLLQLVHIELILSQKLGKKVDLLTEGALKNHKIKENILQDLIIIYK